MVKQPKISNITQKWVRLLLPFTGNYGGFFSGSELSRISGVPQQTSSRLLNGLVKQKVVDFKEIGRNKMFYLDGSKPKTSSVFEILENHKALIFRQKLKEVSVIVDELSKHAESLIVFGSYSSYSFDKSSDLDILLLGESSKTAVDGVRDRYNMEINCHYMKYKEFSSELKKRTPLAIEIFKNHTIFGNVSNVVIIFLEASK